MSILSSTCNWSSVSPLKQEEEGEDVEEEEEAVFTGDNPVPWLQAQRGLVCITLIKSFIGC